MSRSKAFFLNGGAGRIICSVPALEKYYEESGDKDFIIVCEGGTDIFKGHPFLDERTYDIWHKDLFREKIASRDMIRPEPYNVWEYYNQQCSLAQAFDIEINKQGIRSLPKPTMRLNKEELISGRQTVTEIKTKLKKEKLVVIQPFGRGIEHVDGSFVDRTGRSFEYKDLKTIIKKLQQNDYAVALMGEMSLELKEEKMKDEIAQPTGVGIRTWAGIIKYADHFLGCDSLGQHLAYVVDTPATVVTGSTFPINVSYPDTAGVNILDMGEIDREYSPIRITQDERVDRKNETIMSMTPEIIEVVVNSVIGKTDE
jgi:ADP-heptose:LPS heptosyltransferase